MGFIITLIISLVIIINFLFAFVVLFIERRDVRSTWAWLMVLFTVPIVGFFIYIFFGRRFKKDNFYKLTEDEERLLNSTMAKKRQEINSILSQDDFLNKHSDIIRMNLESSYAFLSTDNEIKIFDDGNEKFNSLLQDIRNAEEEVNVQYYIIQPDGLGQKLRDVLVEKAKQGVKVRLLYDAIGSKKAPPSFFRDITKHGGEVGVFFPSMLRLINFRINNRNHRKVCVIDGETAYIGGFNVGDEYLGLKKKFGYWRDTHLNITGDAVNHIQSRFILDWVYAMDKKTAEAEKFCFTEGSHSGANPVQIIASGPNSETEHIKHSFIRMIMGAKKSVYIQTPYFIPDPGFMDACKMALLAGVDVCIMIPNKPDHPFVYWATWSHVGKLLDYGAKIYLYDNGFLHAKTIVVDEEIASVGTANIDSRSFKLNFEINANIYDKKTSTQLADLFIKDMDKSSQMTLESYGNRSFIIKVKESISRLLSPIL